MRIRLSLHLVDRQILLFEGTPDKCPPIPRLGDDIVHENRRVRLEGVSHEFLLDDLLEISLLA